MFANTKYYHGYLFFRHFSLIALLLSQDALFFDNFSGLFWKLLEAEKISIFNKSFSLVLLQHDWYTFSVIQNSEKIARNPPLCQREVNKPRFACVSLGKASFCLISFDAQLCLKRKKAGIVSWIVKTRQCHIFSSNCGKGVLQTRPVCCLDVMKVTPD